MRNKPTAFAALILAALLLLVSCAAKKEAGDDTEKIDPSTPVISIGDESVSYAMFNALYENYLPYMQYIDSSYSNSTDSLASFRSWITDLLTDDLVALYQAKLSGFKLSAEQESEFETSVEEEINALYSSLRKLAEDDYEEDGSIPVDVYFEGIVNSESEYYTGIAMSWEDYKEYYREQAYNSAVVSAYKDHVSVEFVPDGDRVSDWYESSVTGYRETYSSNPELYKTDEENYELYFGMDDGIYPVTYVPSGYSRIMQIVVTPTGELSSEYSAKISRMDEIKAEFSTLIFEDELNGTTRNRARLDELMNEYRELKASSDADYAAYVADAESKIEDALAALAAGEDFRDVMLRYTEEEIIIGNETEGGCEAFREKGRLISLEYTSSNDWSENVKSEFNKLSVGQYSGVFMEDGSYRVIYYASDETSGEVPLSVLYDDIAAVCTLTVQQEQWESLLSEWKNDPALIIDYELIATIGSKEND